MTNKEALQSMMPMKVPDNLITKVFNERNLNEGDVYSSTFKKEIDMVYVELLNFVIAKPEISEGGLNIKIDKGMLMRERDRILKRYGMEEKNIKDGTNRW